MASTSDAILQRVDETVPRLRAMTEAEASHKPGPDRWSKKEILGHLIDSASNNHHRFVRAQLEQELVFPDYEQEGWARCQCYADAGWPLLIDLWAAYNRHLAWVVDHISPQAHGTLCRIGENEPVTLEWLTTDYVSHMDHHLKQLMRPVEKAH